MRGRRESERSCIVTRTVKAPEAMVRFVLDPEGRVVPDLRARLPGRGAWVTATRACVAEAAKRGLFRRAFKRPGKGGESESVAGISSPGLSSPGPSSTGISWDEDLAGTLEAALRQDLRGALALANKAGAVVTGFAKVESLLGAPAGVAALLHAREASPDGRRKLFAALHRAGPDAISRVPVIDDLSNDELDMALGRDHVIHAALVAGAGSAGCLARWRRLRAYRGESPPDAPGPSRLDVGSHDPDRQGSGRDGTDGPATGVMDESGRQELNE